MLSETNRHKYTMHDSTYMWYPEESNSWKQNVKWWLLGAEGSGKEELLFNGYRVLDLQDKKSSGDLFHNSVPRLNTTELYP